MVRRSRRGQNKPPEIVPPKEDVDDDSTDDDEASEGDSASKTSQRKGQDSQKRTTRSGGRKKTTRSTTSSQSSVPPTAPATRRSRRQQNTTTASRSSSPVASPAKKRAATPASTRTRRSRRGQGASSVATHESIDGDEDNDVDNDDDSNTSDEEGGQPKDGGEGHQDDASQGSDERDNGGDDKGTGRTTRKRGAAATKKKTPKATTTRRRATKKSAHQSIASSFTTSDNEKDDENDREEKDNDDDDDNEEVPKEVVTKTRRGKRKREAGDDDTPVPASAPEESLDEKDEEMKEGGPGHDEEDDNRSHKSSESKEKDDPETKGFSQQNELNNDGAKERNEEIDDHSTDNTTNPSAKRQKRRKSESSTAEENADGMEEENASQEDASETAVGESSKNHVSRKAVAPEEETSESRDNETTPTPKDQVDHTEAVDDPDAAMADSKEDGTSEQAVRASVGRRDDDQDPEHRTPSDDCDDVSKEKIELLQTASTPAADSNDAVETSMGEKATSPKDDAHKQDVGVDAAGKVESSSNMNEKLTESKEPASDEMEKAEPKDDSDQSRKSVDEKPDTRETVDGTLQKDAALNGGKISSIGDHPVGGTYHDFPSGKSSQAHSGVEKPNTAMTESGSTSKSEKAFDNQKHMPNKLEAKCDIVDVALERQRQDEAKLSSDDNQITSTTNDLDVKMGTSNQEAQGPEVERSTNKHSDKSKQVQPTVGNTVAGDSRNLTVIESLPAQTQDDTAKPTAIDVDSNKPKDISVHRESIKQSFDLTENDQVRSKCDFPEDDQKVEESIVSNSVVKPDETVVEDTKSHTIIVPESKDKQADIDVHDQQEKEVGDVIKEPQLQPEIMEDVDDDIGQCHESDFDEVITILETKFDWREWEELEDPDNQMLFTDEKSPQTIETTRWASLSKLTSSSTGSYDSLALSGLEERKLNRAKSILFAVGSQAHDGKGFERVFAEYWDALCLRLSGRLSDYVSHRCELAISAFLNSTKLRRLHNRFIIGKILRLRSFLSSASIMCSGSR